MSSVSDYHNAPAQHGSSPDVMAILCNIRLFQSTGDPQSVLMLSGTRGYNYLCYNMGRALGATPIWSVPERTVADYSLCLLSLHAGRPGEAEAAALFAGIASGMTDKTSARGSDSPGRAYFQQAGETGVSLSNLATYAFPRLCWGWYVIGESDGSPVLSSEAHQFVWNMPDKVLVPLLDEHGQQGLTDILAKYRPKVIREWLKEYARSGIPVPSGVWEGLMRGHAEFEADAAAALSIASTIADRWAILVALHACFPEHHRPKILEEASPPSVAAMGRLVELEPEFTISQLARLIAGPHYEHHYFGYEATFEAAAHRAGGEGATVFDAGAKQPDARIHFSCLEALAKHPAAASKENLENWCRSYITDHTAAELVMIWGEILKLPPTILIPELWELLGNKSKKLRSLAVVGLWRALGESANEEAAQRLGHKKADVRLGAAAMLIQIGGDGAQAVLRGALEQETSEAVRSALHDALETFAPSAPASTESVKKQDGSIPPIVALEASLATKTATKSGIVGLDLKNLPPLPLPEGKAFSTAAVSHILEKQSKHKTIKPAPDILPWLAHVDRTRSGDFAVALLSAWLAEGQDAKHRWVLALAGMLGDSRIISTLLPWIPKWCEAAQHKLAEYAAQGISLLGSNEALMVLDTLAARYRSKFRNVGAAAAAAFQSAAQARGISPDELGDLVVPSFDFNEDGQRRFEWDGGAALAELTMDLKLEWSDPDSGQSLKALPASAPDGVKADVKELGKLLRETGKAQALRLEQALVKQRRWPVAAWQELYEKHPLLRAYATRLVWGVYTPEGTLQRAFRRYPNGILADAAGAMEELPEGDGLIGLLHPLDLDGAALSAWQAHLTRFKVQPPFPQLDRPVERLELNLHNRRTLAAAEGREISYGTFSSRAEKRGWVRGSVVDAGGISSYYKLFPGAGVEVSLETGDMYVGMDPMETLTLGTARFCTAGTIQRGSYVYDEPSENDPRILTFGKVPPVVYSETVSDLKAIIARKEEEPHL